MIRLGDILSFIKEDLDPDEVDFAVDPRIIRLGITRMESLNEPKPNVVCAWCNTPIKYNKDIPAGKISHGICKSCAKKVLKEKDDDEVNFPTDSRIEKLYKSNRQATKPFKDHDTDL